MKILFDSANILFEDGREKRGAFVVVEDDIITKISDERPEGDFDRIIDCRDRLLCAGLYNTHCHAAMSVFRGYGECLPLDRWLNEKIWPAEDRLTGRVVYLGSLLAIAEMIKNGIVSFSDMYFFCEDTAKAVIDSGIKANISRCVMAFDESVPAENDERFKEGIELYKNYHGKGDGRLLIDMALHAEYTVTANACRYVSDFALKHGLNIQVHLSETEKEHKEGISRRGGLTPAKFLEQNGVFRVPVTAAHCVHISEDDMEILAANGAFIAHNPASNLKLGSGVMPLSKIYDKGVTVALGTDGAASNNTLDILKEAYLASLLQKGTTGDTAKLDSGFFVRMATENGARAQGRANCGKIAEGYRADIILIDLGAVNTIPHFELKDTFLFAANASNITLTMVDGKILYENGTFLTIDIEKLKKEFSETIKDFYSE